MIILKPIIICIVALVITMMLKNIMPEYAPAVSLICGIVLLVYIIPYIKSIYDVIYKFENIIPQNITGTIKITIRIVIIALMCEFASQLCLDSGESYLASKINFIGKIIIISIISPTVITFIENIVEMLKIL